jgi:hypothetical protein
MPKTFIVKAQNLLSENLPGIVMTLASPLLPHDPVTNECLSALQLGMSVLRAVPVEVHQRDIAIHESSHNSLGSCARVPIHMCLVKDTFASLNDNSFVVKSKLYNPKIYVGDGVVVNIDQALGLEIPLHGLTIEAPSNAGLKLGCTWLGTSVGRAMIAEKSFIEYKEVDQEPSPSASSTESTTKKEEKTTTSTTTTLTQQQTTAKEDQMGKK